MTSKIGWAAIAIVALVAVQGCGDDEPSAKTEGSSANQDEDVTTSSEASSLTAHEVADRVRDAGLGCEDAQDNPDPEGGSTDSVICTLGSGEELTLDGFADEAGLAAFEALGRQGCGFYPAGSEIPYAAGRWWTASVSIEMEDLGADDLDRTPYVAIAEAADGELRTISC